MAVLEMADGRFVNISEAYVILAEEPSRDDWKLVGTDGSVIKCFERRSDMFFFATENDIRIATVH